MPKEIIVASCNINDRHERHQDNEANKERDGKAKSKAAVGKSSNTTVIGDPEEEKQSSGTKLKFKTVIQENVPEIK